MRTYPFVALACAATVFSCGGSDTGSTHHGDDAFTEAPAPVGGPEPHGNPTKFPIVLVHGFMASPTSFWGSFFKVPETLRADGHTVFVPTLPPFDSVEVRAESLARQLEDILHESGASKVNLLAHSMGGLDCRDVITRLGFGDRVASLTTISTPHGGSAVADVILHLLPGDSDRALNALAQAFGDTFSDANQDPHLRAALTALAESTAPGFNEAHPDDERVHYQSWAGVSSVAGISNPADRVACEGNIMTFQGRAHVMEALLVGSAAFVTHGTKLRPNDGLVMVESAKHGEFRGCIPVSHLSELGQISLEGANRRTGLDHLRFYRSLAFELAAKGF
jgi:triacylglycerol lipase